MRELDEWIHINIFGWTLGRELKYPNRPAYFLNGVQMLACDAPRYSADPAAMLVLKKCAEKLIPNAFVIESPIRLDPKWCVGATTKSITASGDTLELAICQFARQLFEKGNQ